LELRSREGSGVLHLRCRVVEEWPVMSNIRVDMTMSLDGFVTGADDGPDAPMAPAGSACSTGSTSGTAPGQAARCSRKRWRCDAGLDGPADRHS
jgi:hypothetical protein